ncbi:arylamine N-acetyltransferase [bacterium]|nr:arylamine N-acetyltransferase [bacterium]
MQSVISSFSGRYCLRTGTPDVIQLKQIGAAFSHLPYENVTKILKEARSTSVREKLRGTEEVLTDHLRWNTGGTCFSLCNALISILRNSGFDAFIAMADMHYGANIHCVVLVSLPPGRFLLDPGYLLHDPIRIPDHGLEQAWKTAMNTVVLRNEGNDNYSLFTVESGQRKWRYRLRACSVSAEEFEAHWIHSFSLNSMQHLMMTRLDDRGRLYFRKNHLEHVNDAERIMLARPDAGELSGLFGVPADLIIHARDILLARPHKSKAVPVLS